MRPSCSTVDLAFFSCRQLQTAHFSAQEIRLVEKAVESLGISKASVRTNAGTKTAVVTHLSKVKPDRHMAWPGTFLDVFGGGPAGQWETGEGLKCGARLWRSNFWATAEGLRSPFPGFLRISLDFLKLMFRELLHIAPCLSCFTIFTASIFALCRADQAWWQRWTVSCWVPVAWLHKDHLLHSMQQSMLGDEGSEICCSWYSDSEWWYRGTDQRCHPQRKSRIEDSRGFAWPMLVPFTNLPDKAELRNPPIGRCWTRRIQEVQSLCRAAKCREQLGWPSWSLGRHLDVMLQKRLSVKNSRIARSPQHSSIWRRFI